MDLREQLVKATEAYLVENKKFYSFFWGMGQTGNARANEYLLFLKRTDLNEDALFKYVLECVRDGLDSSRHYRKALTQVLCRYHGISEDQISFRADRIYVGALTQHGKTLKTYAVAYQQAMFALLKENEHMPVQKMGTIATKMLK